MFVSSYFPQNQCLPTKDELFYVSYLSYSEDYGSDTTALVVGQMQRFFILNGDFRKQYEALIPQGFRACYEFFLANLDKRNPKNETTELESVEALEKLMQDYNEFLIKCRNKDKR